MNPRHQSGGVTLYHGDCSDVVTNLPKVDLVLTDPPYAIGASRGEWGVTASVAIGLYEAAKLVKRDGSMVVFTTTSGRGIEFTIGAVGKRLAFNRMLVWHKRGGRSRAVSPFAWDSVAILLFGRAPQSKLAHTSVFETDATYERETDHVAELPAALAEWLYLPFDRDGLTVLDPFMGSAALLGPAYRRGRNVIGIEADAGHCDAAAQRFGAWSTERAA